MIVHFVSAFCGIQFDEHLPHLGHDCDGNGKDGHCYYLYAHELEKLSSGKKRTKIRRPDIDPFDEEDWGYEEANEKFNNESDKFEMGDIVVVKRSYTAISTKDLWEKTGIVVDYLPYPTNSMWGIQFNERFSYGHSCNGKGKDGHCYYLFFEDVEKISSGKKRTKIRKPDIDPFDEEDWGFVQESFLDSEKETYIKSNSEKEVNDVLNILVEMGYTLNGWDKIYPLSRAYVLHLSNNRKTIQYSSFNFYFWKQGIRNFIEASDFLSSFKKRIKIRKPDIDPFDEEDWGFVQESAKYEQEYNIGDMIKISSKLQYYINNYHWDGLETLIGKTFEIRKIEELAAIEKKSYVIKFPLYNSVYDYDVYIPFDCVEVGFKGKKRIKIRRPDIDPFDEEDWGFVQESADNEEFRIGDRVRLRDDVIAKSDFDIKLFPKIKDQEGEIIKIYSDDDNTTYNSECIVKWNTHLIRDDEENEFVFKLEEIELIDKTKRKKRIKIRRPDIDPFDEEDWGYIQESVCWDREEHGVGDVVELYGRVDGVNVFGQGTIEDVDYDNAVETNMGYHGERDFYEYHGLCYYIKEINWYVSKYNIVGGNKRKTKRIFSPEDPYGEEIWYEDEETP